MMPPGRLLWIKPSSLGDIVNALPALEMLHRSWPKTSVDWIIKREWAHLLDNHPMIHELILFPRNRGEWFETVRELRQRRYDMSVDLQGLLRSGLLGLMSGVPVRVGFGNAREGSRWCYTHRIETKGGVIHAVERNLQLLQEIGVCTNGVRHFPLPENHLANQWLQDLWVDEGISPYETVCVVHPATRRATKQWPVERFADLVNRLMNGNRCRIVLVSGRAEAEQTEKLGKQVQGPAINLAGKTTLPQLLALLRNAAVLVTNDSGPMHLAAAVGTPVVAIFGPTDPRRVGPYGSGHVILQKETDCSSCRRHTCVKNNLCLKAVGVEEVYSAVQIQIQRRQSIRKDPASGSALQ